MISYDKRQVIKKIRFYIIVSIPFLPLFILSLNKMNCNYQIISESRLGAVVWCHNCQGYSIYFRQYGFCLSPFGFDQFKEALHTCYDEHQHLRFNGSEQLIVFHSEECDLDFCLSISDIGSLLHLFQMSDFNQFADERLTY